MSSFPNSPRLLKGGIVLLDPGSGAVQRVIPLQYNPDTLTRQLQVQGAGGDPGERTEALRLKGPPVETIRFEAEIDATDDLETPDQHATTVEVGIQPHLAVLETIVYPASAQLQSNNRLAASGTLEILPAEAPLTLFVWSKNRVMPVRITEFNITEQAFDPFLNTIRAQLTISLRVLSVADVGFDQRAGSLFLAYQQQKESLSRRFTNGSLGSLGINSIP